MSGETNLRDRWDPVFHGTARYVAAQEHDAMQKAARTAAARNAIQSALRRGDAHTAAAIQQRMQEMDVQDQLGQGGGATAGLDQFQNNRVADYINEARTRGQQTATAARALPLAGVTNGAGYYDSLENPNFEDFTPNAVVRRPLIRNPNAAPVSPTVPVPMQFPSVGAQVDIDAKAKTLANIRNEQALLHTLPKDLADAYQGYYQTKGGATNEERAAFLSKPAAVQYNELHYRAKQQNPEKTPTSQTDVLPVYLSNDNYTSRTPTVSKPVTLTETKSELIPKSEAESPTPEEQFAKSGPTDYLADAASYKSA